MREPLILPMMMFGKFRGSKAKRDKEGNTIIKRRDSKGRPVYEQQKCWVTHSEKQGDKGIYPSVNHMYTRMAKGRQKLTVPAEKLKEKWEAAAYEWVHKTGWQKTDNEKIVLEFVSYFPNDKIRRDASNAIKLMMDAFNGILYEDDEYALPRVMDFHRVTEEQQPYFELTIYLKSEEDEVLMQRIAS